MLKAVVLFCLLALISTYVSADDAVKEDGRIVNGQAIDISQAAHTVQLKLLYGGLFCGGTLVAPQYVVTAAHCFDTQSAEYTRVVAGATTNPGTGQERRVIGIMKPQGYTSTNMNNDIAILKLESPMILGSTVKTVPLCSQPLAPGSPLLITGWGSMQTGGYNSDYLRGIVIPSISHDQCVTSHRNTRTPVTNAMFCAHGPSKDSCQGDSGGPAVYNGQLCGVVSWGVGCAAGHPGVYTDVYALRSFIVDSIRRMQ